MKYKTSKHLSRNADLKPYSGYFYLGGKMIKRRPLVEKKYRFLNVCGIIILIILFAAIIHLYTKSLDNPIEENYEKNQMQTMR